MDTKKISAFLTDLAVSVKDPASTQNQAKKTSLSSKSRSISKAIFRPNKKAQDRYDLTLSQVSKFAF